MTKWGLKDRTGTSSAAKYIDLDSALDQALVQAMPPVPGWMADIAAGHNRMSDDKRVPEMFWFFLRRKMEQVRSHLAKCLSILFLKRIL